MVNLDRLIYPAFIQQDDEGIFCVYFPTLFLENGWEYPLTRRETRHKAIQDAKKDLAYTLAGILYDNVELPEPSYLNRNDLSEGMELVEIETSFEPYAEEIKEHLKGRHWHITYYDEENDDYIEAIGYKNEQGMWDIYFEDFSTKVEYDNFDSPNQKKLKYPMDPLLFSVKFYSDAEEKFSQYVENVILKQRGNK